MSGVTLRDGVLEVDREPNELDELAADFSELLSAHDVAHVFVAGYVAILTGRARSTEDIDVIVERLSAARTDDLVSALDAADYWGPAMPLEEMYGNLSAGTNIWVAPDGQTTPHLEVSFPTDRYDSASLENALAAQIGGHELPIGPLELQIAYKLYLGTRTDFEDAAHLYVLFRESLSEPALERWVEDLDVEGAYERLRSV